jgi:hypothetical protein
MHRKTFWTDEKQASYMANRNEKDERMESEAERIEREADERLHAIRHFCLSEEEQLESAAAIKDANVRSVVQGILYDEEYDRWWANLSEQEKAEIAALKAEADEEFEKRSKKACRVLVREYGDGLIPVYPASCGNNTPGARTETACIGRSGNSICGSYLGSRGEYALCTNTSGILHNLTA